jgi:hypothetical protein
MPSKEFQRIHSFVLDTSLSVKEAVECEDRATLYLALSQQAFDEYNQMQMFLATIQLEDSGKDVWKIIWKDGVYTAHIFYKHFFMHISTSRIYSWIWKSKVLLGINVFAWLLISDGLNTRDMLRRCKWNVTNVFTCVLCPTHQTKEWIHLFSDWNFSR